MFKNNKILNNIIQKRFFSINKITPYRNSIDILDGSISGEISKSLCSINNNTPNIHPILSTLINDPLQIESMHNKYLNAGATIITTTNFNCLPHLLQYENNKPNIRMLTSLAGQLAKNAINNYNKNNNNFKKLKVAGCIPALNNTSEILTHKEQSKLLHNIIEDLDSYVDLYICESLVCIEQAELAASIAMKTNKPVWLSFKLDNNKFNMPRLYNKESISQAINRLLNTLPRFVDAYILTSSNLNNINQALPILQQLTHRPIGAIANLPFDMSKQDNLQYAQTVLNWVETYHLSIVGGYGGVNIQQIKMINDLLNGNNIKENNNDNNTLLLNNTNILNNSIVNKNI